MNTVGVIITLLASMAVGYVVSHLFDERFYFREWLSEQAWTVKVKPWMVVLATLVLIVGIGLLMWLVGAPEITYYIVSGGLIGVMLVVLPKQR